MEVDGDFTWGRRVDKPFDLNEIDFTVKKGDFVCIIGDVGAGKSSLLSAINGDMISIPKGTPMPIKKNYEGLGAIDKPVVRVQGKISFVE